MIQNEKSGFSAAFFFFSLAFALSLCYTEANNSKGGIFMYRYSAPIYNSHITPERREAYLQTFRAAKIERVFLIAKYNFETGEVYDIPLLCENIAWLRAQGISPSIWAGETLGHGGLLHDVKGKDGAPALTPIRNFDGVDQGGTRCPTDKRFADNLAQIFRTLASTHPDYILVDDDFRMSYRGRVHACVCDAHLAEMSRRYGSPVTPEQVRDAVMHGGPNALRDMYLQTMGDTLRDLAQVLRAAVDEADDTVGLALCTVHSHWDLEGVDPVELTHIFAGKKRQPLLRLHGAPYWAWFSQDKDLPHVLEHARMFAGLSAGNGFELMNELDAYPRPRRNCPAAYMELVDAVMRADNTTHGALKYMYDYVSPLGYETGYLDAHERDLPALEKLEKMFAAGEQAGVRVCVEPHLIAESDSDLTPPYTQMPRPIAGTMLTRCSIPTTYTGKGLCRAVFGEAVTRLPESALGEGLVLDAVSALLLTERGVDVGLVKGQDLRACLHELSPNRVLDEKDNPDVLVRAKGSFLTAALKKEAHVLLYVPKNDERLPLCYTYENAKGQRFLVWLFHAASIARNSDLTDGYMIQKAMMEGVEWVARRPLPVKCEKHPQLYVMCRKDAKTLTVGLFHCFPDTVFAPTLTLDGCYAKITDTVNTSAALTGNTVTLQDLPPFSFCAFTVE